METAILLATYNSSKYIREQLDSLYNQTYTEWTIYVHDDGSNDDTIEIIEEYKNKYGNIKIISPEIKHLGPKKNFMHLLSNVDADYYFFCDHDDIWLSDKIFIALSQIKANEGANRNLPVVFHSDLSIVDGNLNLIDKSLWHYAKILPELMHNKKYVMTSCYITGCTLAINKATKNIIPPIPDNAIMHDWWIGIHAVLKGVTIISYPEPTILYRIHGHNDSGISKNSLFRYIKLIFKSFTISEYDKKIAPFIKEYKIYNYKYYKSMLILKRLLYYRKK